jgi:hypothetical protein
MTRFDRLGVTFDFTTGFKLLEELIRHLKFEERTGFVTLQEARRELDA